MAMISELLEAAFKNETREEFISKLKLLRKVAGLSQREVAEQIGCSESAYMHLEQGLTRKKR